MQTEKDSTIKLKRLSEDSDFYNNVFKKTEKIVSVIFYILSETKQNDSSKTHVEAIKDRAFKTHEAALETLTLFTHEAEEGLLQFQYKVVALESSLRIASVARVLPGDIFMLLADQIDSLLRYISNHYLNSKGVQLSDSLLEKPTTPTKSTTPRKQRVRIPAGDISTDAYLVHSQMTDRAERIKTVLEAKPQATVKDISEVITDVSEKTIQRELNSLIEKGQVVREGERRWSKYSVPKPV